MAQFVRDDAGQFLGRDLFGVQLAQEAAGQEDAPVGGARPFTGSIS